ncbi:MAG: ribosome silencing factor [Betaproteobacteria bacterium]|nr:ribosome silencing factor [Betaproteobacteria bacterium]
MNTDQIVAAVIDAIEDIKGKDIVVLDVSAQSPLFERMVLASADSTRQTRAIIQHVHEKLKELGVPGQGTEGLENGEWVLLDLGSVIVHVMQPAVRQYYSLETLWSTAADQRNRRNEET